MKQKESDPSNTEIKKETTAILYWQCPQCEQYNQSYPLMKWLIRGRKGNPNKLRATWNGTVWCKHCHQDIGVEELL